MRRCRRAAAGTSRGGIPAHAWSRLLASVAGAWRVPDAAAIAPAVTRGESRRRARRVSRRPPPSSPRRGADVVRCLPSRRRSSLASSASAPARTPTVHSLMRRAGRRLHPARVDAEQRPRRLDGDRQRRGEDRRAAAGRTPRRRSAAPLGTVAAERDRVVAQAQRDLARQLFHEAVAWRRRRPGGRDRCARPCRRSVAPVAASDGRSATVGARRRSSIMRRRSSRASSGVISSLRATASLKCCPPTSIVLKKLISRPRPITTWLRRSRRPPARWTSCSSSRRRMKRSTLR